MALSPGHRLGPYEILSAIGAGGMGEVYRARDTRLGRTVALKVLRARSMDGAEARRNLLHEARAISSLDHPHICTLFDVGSQDGIDYLVMEHLDGETLSARLVRGPLPPGEAIRVAIQIAGALEAAHRRSITHHDLKPANIMLTPSGAKLLDFGIARLRPSGPISSDAPTLTRLNEPEEDLPCTLPYAAPELISGGPVDGRADLWALGATLYEMTTGRAVFDRGSGRATIAAILDLEPQPLATVAPNASPGLERAVRQCLAKNPDDRWQTAGDLRRELEWIAASESARSETVRAGRRAWIRRPWLWAALFLVAVAGVGVGSLLRPTPTPEVVRFRIFGPHHGGMSTTASDMAVSPDGSGVAFLGSDDAGHSGIWVRRLSELAPSYLPGTNGAIYPFWSPDSRHIAFFAEGKLKRVPVLGGEVTTLSDAPDARGGTWGSRGVIVFAPSLNTNLQQIPADGGAPRPAIAADSIASDDRFPCFLPDGRHFLYTHHGGVVVGSLDAAGQTPVLEMGRAAVYAAPGYLVFGRDGYLVAQRFDANRLRLAGSPVPLKELEAGSRNTGDQTASVSNTGLLAYPTTEAGHSEFYWTDLAGKEHGALPLSIGPVINWRLSPDGHKVALTAGTPGRSTSIWIYDIASATAERLTYGPGRDQRLIWSPDSKRIVFQSVRDGANGLYLREAVAGAADSLLFSSRTWMDPVSWSKDAILAFGRLQPVTGYDIWLMPMHGSRVPVPYLQTPATEKAPFVSPDGNWLAYESNESGRFEVYVQSFPRAGTKYQVSTTGGRSPGWSRDGRELFYDATGRGGVSVVVDGKEALRFGAPGSSSKRGPGTNSIDSPDGPRFLGIRPVEAGEAASLTIVQNWTAILAPAASP